MLSNPKGNHIPRQTYLLYLSVGQYGHRARQKQGEQTSRSKKVW